MMKKALQLIVCSLACSFLSSCSSSSSGSVSLTSGEYETASYKGSDSSYMGDTDFNVSFENFSFSSMGSVTIMPVLSGYVTSSENYEENQVYPLVSIEYPKDFPGLKVSFSKDTITIKNSKEVTFSGRDVYIHVYANVKKINVTGALPVYLDASRSSSLDVSFSGASSLETSTALCLSSINIAASGASSFILDGECDDFSATISGVSTINAKDLSCKNANFDVSGTATISCSVSDSLIVTISGLATITYYGDPKVESHISGAGSVNKG